MGTGSNWQRTTGDDGHENEIDQSNESMSQDHAEDHHEQSKGEEEYANTDFVDKIKFIVSMRKRTISDDGSKPFSRLFGRVDSRIYMDYDAKIRVKLKLTDTGSEISVIASAYYSMDSYEYVIFYDARHYKVTYISPVQV